jgi:hypothetical protein
VLAVAVRVGLRGAPAGAPRLAAGALDARLHLSDGTALAHVPAGRLAREHPRDAERIAGRALDLSLLEAWERERPGFLFFDLAGVRVQGTRALVRTAASDREVDLLDSLLAFRVATDEGPREVFVGLGRARWNELALEGAP